MLDLLGVDLEPLLVVYVDIDPQQGQMGVRQQHLQQAGDCSWELDKCWKAAAASDAAVNFVGYWR
eukprot:gene1423-1766_t